MKLLDKWMTLLLFLSFGFYLPALYQKNKSYNEILSVVENLKKEKETLLYEHGNLILQIESQSDPLWVEMILKRQLGLVPKGQSKVHFTKDL